MEGTAGSFPKLCLGEGNDHPLQSSCLENPTDRGAWAGGCSIPWHRKESDTTERLTLLKVAAALDDGQQENKDLKRTAARKSTLNNPLSFEEDLVYENGTEPGQPHDFYLVKT